MSNRSLLKRLFTLVVLMGLMAASSYAQEEEAGVVGADGAAGDMEAVEDPYQDKSPEEINVQQIVGRRRQTLLAQQLMEKGLEHYAQKEFKDAIDNYTRAETNLKQISDSHPDVLTDLNLVQKRLGDAYSRYAEQLIERARREVDVSHFDSALENISKAISYDQSLRSEAQRLQRRIDTLRVLVEIQHSTRPEKIDPEYQTRLKNILIKKAEARVFMNHNLHKRARDAFEDVLLTDPGDVDAINGLTRLYSDLRRSATLRRRAQEEERMAEIEWKWVDPIPPRDGSGPGLPGSMGVGEPVEKTRESATASIRNKLRTIIIPKISFEDVPVTTVLNFLKSRSRDLDPEGVGVNFMPILHPPQRTATAQPPADGRQPDAFPADDPFGAPAGDPFGAPAGAPAGDPFGAPAGDPFGAPAGDPFGAPADDPFGAPAGGFGADPAPITAGAGEWQEPTISMEFDNIPLSEAIRYVCEGAGLDYKVEQHAVIVLGPDVSQGRLELRFFPVDPRLLRAEEAGDGDVDYQKFFQDKGVSFPTTGTGEVASISYDRGTSKLIVRNTTENLRLIETILQEINQAIPQVTIEAKFVEVRQNSLEELSFQWMFLGSPEGSPKVTPRYGNTQHAINPGALATSTRAINNIGSMLSIDTIIGNSEFNTMIHFFNRKDGTDVLSAPKVTVQSGKEAYISMIEERRFPEDFDQPEFNIQDGAVSYTPPAPIFGEAREDLGITLRVTPQVAEDGISVSLELHPKVVEFIAYDTTFNSVAIINGEPQELRYDTPIFEVREIRTEVTVWDGETVVLGGSIRDNLQKIDDKVPLLGDLPLIGRLFQSRGEVSEKKNLLMFVSARIVSPSGLPLREHDIRGLPDFRR